MGEGDRPISLLGRLLQHAETTARFNVYFGEGRDAYDVRGRVAHESIFNVNDGAYRCPSSQQGYSPFTTWTRGLAWIVCGYAEQLEFLATLPDDAFAGRGRQGAACCARFREVAEATADFFIARHADRRRALLGHGRARASRSWATTWAAPAEPFNDHEPVDSSAAAIAAQGLLRLGNFLVARGRGGARPALPPGRPHRGAHALRRALPLDRPRATRACCCTPSTTGRTAGTTCPRAARCPAASPRCGATTTRASWRCSSCARPKASPTPASSSTDQLEGGRVMARPIPDRLRGRGPGGLLGRARGKARGRRAVDRSAIWPARSSSRPSLAYPFRYNNGSGPYSASTESLLERRRAFYPGEKVTPVVPAAPRRRRVPAPSRCGSRSPSRTSTARSSRGGPRAPLHATATEVTGALEWTVPDVKEGSYFLAARFPDKRRQAPRHPQRDRVRGLPTTRDCATRPRRSRSTRAA